MGWVAISATVFREMKRAGAVPSGDLDPVPSNPAFSLILWLLGIAGCSRDGGRPGRIPVEFHQVANSCPIGIVRGTPAVPARSGNLLTPMAKWRLKEGQDAVQVLS